ncbi:MAG: AbrB/MazE/SpoVT family DNA-binding domain-containing protein [Pseudonocardia sp.]|nr:AbrB/MazE/SpoVT family DNA-binding domain-containing protein [Pseudonocardia sp.]
MTVEVQREPTTKVSSKNQITLPVAALRAANVAPGDVLRVEVLEDGVFRLIRERDPWWDLFEESAGMGFGVTTLEELEELRDEWER